MKKKIIAILTCVLLVQLFVGCSSEHNNETQNPSEITGNSGDQLVTPAVTQAPVIPANTLDTNDMFSNRDKEIGYDENSSIIITLSDANTEASSDTVQISNSTVTITTEGTYILTGTLTNGQIIVDAEKTENVQLVLNGMSVNCDTSAAIYVKQADKVVITLAQDKQNVLTNKSEFVAIDENNIDSVIYSKDDLTLNGLGTLTVNATYGHGIVSKDDLVFTSGTYNITSERHGIAGKDSVRIADGTFTIDSGSDSIHAENSDDTTLGFIYIAEGSFHLTSETDGIDASATLLINDGTFNILSGGGSNASTTQTMEFDKFTSATNTNPSIASNISTASNLPTDSNISIDNTNTSTTDTVSTKGLKATGDVIIQSGIFEIDSFDDSVHSNSNVFINGGTFQITSGDDGIHADTMSTINGGTLTITNSYEGIEGQSVQITGGVVSIISSDDGINAAGGNDQSGMGGRPGMGRDSFTADSDCYIIISGGKITVNASGDGIDSNGSLTVTGGETYVSGPTNSGNATLDYDGEAQITGGIFIAVGTSGMAQNFGTSSTQGCILVNTSNSQTAGSVITLNDEKGNCILTYTPEKQYNSVIISTPEIIQGKTYSLTMGSDSTEIEMTSLIYGSGGGMGGFGGDKGGFGGNKGNRNFGGVTGEEEQPQGNRP